jgi:hypothetical protein
MHLLHWFNGAYIVARGQFGGSTDSRGRPFWLKRLDPSQLIWHVDVVRRLRLDHLGRKSYQRFVNDMVLRNLTEGHKITSTPAGSSSHISFKSWPAYRMGLISLIRHVGLI